MRTGVVTGAGSGLERAIAAELIERGYRVHVTDVDAAPSFSGRLLTAQEVASGRSRLPVART